MAAKRKQKRTKTPDTMGPSQWRLQHGDFTPPIREADPETGRPVQHRRAVDTLGMMLANGTITQEMHDAGATFRRQFCVAMLDGLRIMPLVRISGGGGNCITEKQISARDRVASAMEVLGGADSAAGSCVWHVVGLECSVREWAIRQGWGGRTVPATQAQGMLVSALAVLAGHYRFESKAVKK
ncbi:MAG: hypothetical protein ACK5WA_04420 [Alphaproteobacteria bacterium]